VVVQRASVVSRARRDARDDVRALGARHRRHSSRRAMASNAIATTNLHSVTRSDARERPRDATRDAKSARAVDAVEARTRDERRDERRRST
jgi:hypothetical protein